MELRIIKTDKQYRRYLKEVAKLAVRDPGLKSREGGRLELLAKLVEDYEKERFEFSRPDPVEAIAFRMEQQGLRQKDIPPALLTASAIATITLLLAGCSSSSMSVPFVTPLTEPTATVQLEPRSGSNVSGSVTFTEQGDNVRIRGEITGHAPGVRGWHIHEKGDCSDPKAMSAGGHFNPSGHKHGAPTDAERHAGDMGNLVFDTHGRAEINVVVAGISTSSGKRNNIIGRALIIHADRDDLKTDPTGNAGGRVACGVITAIYKR